jgi:hypothetical protein
MDTKEKFELMRELGTLSTTAGRASTYVSCRIDSTDHDSAVREQNLTNRKVRKALAYTIIDLDDWRF